ncbi:hypothetical protein [Mucilaginibacter sp.]|uniref:hypothetical protein n=1 Tax=Mucilaginibacter sp. TaxID=1882438 RepID=UPI000CBC30F9|nr:hypothetical protein [Mucilaginibacter sp.]PLW89337.1 MAG: hypothetical protein C0154_11985 [Mucilaginibacter sp.]PMP64646.1 MAG: hypothetical protein C0191_05845 [Mucilaginibacter sp.]HEK20211.1 hypothetical protein [Bacteroidota bacterium]
MKYLFSILSLIIITLIFTPGRVNAQGCVAISGKGSFSIMEHPMLDTNLSAGSEKSWIFTSSYRYFRSFRHFKGTEEQKQRQVLHNEVINWQNTIDLSLTRNFNRFWSVTVGIPYLINTRSSLYEHGGKERHSSYSHGFGDARVVASRWIFDSRKVHSGNLQLGLGVKLPTGDYGYRSYFYNVTPSSRPVDQSIQLGDGGVGIIAELNGFLHLGGRFNGYTNLYYMANPRNTNGTRTFRETLSPTLANEAIMSVPDQYLARLGASYTLSGALSALTVAAGARIEGIPVYDLIGKSDGFRRPGYIFSAEPSLNYSFKRVNIFASVPVALKRDRLQSVTDKENSAKTGTYVIGDAAFADYSINFGVSVKF